MARRALVFLLALGACGDDGGPIPPVQDDRVLVYTRTLGYRHDDAILMAQQVLPARLAMEEVTPDFTEDPAAFTDDNLARYRAVIFLYTTGNDILDPDGKLALERFVRLGGGWLGVHSASDTEYEWPFYKTMLVSYFDTHPDVQPATMTVTAPTHPAMAGIPVGPWMATDEWYNFKTNPRSVLGVDVLATIDETTYTGGTMGTDHPMVWAQERLIGRVLYTAMGHVAERWNEPAYLEHIVGSIRWVTGLAL